MYKTDKCPICDAISPWGEMTEEQLKHILTHGTAKGMFTEVVKDGERAWSLTKRGRKYVEEILLPRLEREKKPDV